MVGVAVVGTGYWGKNHVRVWREMLAEGRIDRLVVCDIDPGRAQKFARMFDIEAITDYRTLLRDEGIDCLSIVTPSQTHAQLATECMRAGKDVLVEKPMTMDSTHAEQMVAVAAETKAVLMVGHIFRYHPAVQELTRRIKRRDLGDLFYLHTNRLAYSAPRRDMGVLWALGIHEVDIYCDLMGVHYPNALRAQWGCHVLPGIDDHALLTLEFGGDTQGTAVESWLSPGNAKQRDLLVVGKRMSARVDYLKPNHLQLFDVSVSEVEEAGGGSHLQLDDEGSHTITTPYSEPLRNELDHFLRCHKERDRPITDGATGLRAVRMIEAVLAHKGTVG